MSQILLVESDEQKAILYSLNLEVFSGTSTIHKSNTKDAIKVLDLIPNISLIVYHSDVKDSESSREFYEYLQNNDISTPVIELTANSVENSIENKNSHIFYISEDIEIKDFVKNVAKILGITATELIKKIVPEFYPIPINTFLYINKSSCDIFIKISKELDSNHYIKRIPKGETLSKEMIERYIEKNVTFLYVLKSDRVNFTNHVSNKMIQNLRNSDLTTNERIEVTQHSFEYLASFFENDQEYQENITLVHETINSIVEITDKYQNDFKAMINNLLGQTDSYRFQNVVTVSYLCIKAVKQTEWGKDSHLHILCYSSLLHDILLTSDRDAMVRSENDLQKIPESYKDFIRRHPFMTVGKFKNIENISMDVQKIVLQHHGCKRGISFPKEVENDLAPLTYVFIACESYAHAILTNKSDIKYEQILDQIPRKCLNTKVWEIIEKIHKKHESE